MLYSTLYCIIDFFFFYLVYFHIATATYLATSLWSGKVNTRATVVPCGISARIGWRRTCASTPVIGGNGKNTLSSILLGQSSVNGACSMAIIFQKIVLLAGKTLLGGSSHVHRFCGLVHPRCFSGHCPHLSHWNNQGCGPHLPTPWGQPSQVLPEVQVVVTKVPPSGVKKKMRTPQIIHFLQDVQIIHFCRDSPLRNHPALPFGSKWKFA